MWGCLGECGVGRIFENWRMEERRGSQVPVETLKTMSHHNTTRTHHSTGFLKGSPKHRKSFTETAGFHSIRRMWSGLPTRQWWRHHSQPMREGVFTRSCDGASNLRETARLKHPHAPTTRFDCHPHTQASMELFFIGIRCIWLWWRWSYGNRSGMMSLDSSAGASFTIALPPGAQQKIRKMKKKVGVKWKIKKIEGMRWRRRSKRSSRRSKIGRRRVESRKRESQLRVEKYK